MLATVNGGATIEDLEAAAAIKMEIGEKKVGQSVFLKMEGVLRLGGGLRSVGFAVKGGGETGGSGPNVGGHKALVDLMENGNLLLSFALGSIGCDRVCGGTGT